MNVPLGRRTYASCCHCVHSPSLFHLVPFLDFLFRLSGEQYVLDREKEQTITVTVKKTTKKNLLIRAIAVLSVADTLCLSHPRSLLHASPVVSFKADSFFCYGSCYLCRKL